MKMMINRSSARSAAVLFCLCAALTLAMTASCKKSPDISRWVTTPDGLKLRAAPDVKGAVIATVPHLAEVKFVSENPEAVNIFGTSGKWTEVIFEGKKGYIFGGFLADARPEIPAPGSDAHLVDFAKKYYVDRHRIDFALNIRDITQEAVSAIREKFARDTKVRMRAGNLVILTHKDLSDGSGPGMERETLWAWRASTWHLVEHDYSTPNAWQLLNLNNDNLVDAVSFVFYDETIMEAWLGVSDTELKYIEDSRLHFFAEYDRARGVFSGVKFGRCGETQIPATDYDNEQKHIPISYTFDCEKNQFVKVPRK
jgi:hypothetical protein